MNNRRARSTDSSSVFHRYLKPGALARLRDSKITTSTKSNRIRSMSTNSFSNRSLSSSSLSVPASPTTNHLQIDAFPCFSGSLSYYGPRFLQRKKLVAARSMSVCYLMPPTSPVVVEVGDLAAGAEVAAH